MMPGARYMPVRISTIGCCNNKGQPTGWQQTITTINEIDVMLNETFSEFASTVLGVAQSNDPQLTAFVVLPKEASEKLPRRGRTSITGHINGVAGE